MESLLLKSKSMRANLEKVHKVRAIYAILVIKSGYFVTCFVIKSRQFIANLVIKSGQFAMGLPLTVLFLEFFSRSWPVLFRTPPLPVPSESFLLSAFVPHSLV